jgi:hypothetical protein
MSFEKFLTETTAKAVEKQRENRESQWAAACCEAAEAGYYHARTGVRADDPNVGHLHEWAARNDISVRPKLYAQEWLYLYWGPEK